MSLRASFISGIYLKQVNKNATLRNSFFLPYSLLIFFLIYLSMFPSFQSSPSFLSFPYSLEEPRQGRSSFTETGPELPRMPRSVPSLDSLKKYTVGLYILVDHVPKGNYSYEHSRLLKWMDQANLMLRSATFDTFYLQVELVELKVEEEIYVSDDDTSLGKCMTRWHETSLSTTAHLKYVFSKKNYFFSEKGEGSKKYGMLGVTKMDSICKPSGSGVLIGYKGSENEQKFTATFLHEILHAFDYAHDDGEAVCRGHLMSSSLSSVTKWTYSPCTKEHMEKWIKSSKTCQLKS